MTTPSPRRCSAQQSIGRSSRSRGSPIWMPPGNGRGASCTGITTNTATAASAMSPRHSAMSARMAPFSPPATRSTRTHGNATPNAGLGRPATGHRLASSPSIRSATALCGRQPHKSSFSVRSASLLSRPDLAAPKPRSATQEMGGAEPPAATHWAPWRASMARLASTGPSAKRAPRHTAHQSDHSAAAPTYKRYVTEPGPSESWSGIRGDRCQHWRFSGGRGAKHHLMCHLAPPFFQTALQRP